LAIYPGHSVHYEEIKAMAWKLKIDITTKIEIIEEEKYV